jgi:hypothetical protein
MVFGVPLGISFFGTAFSEPTLIKLASGFEAVTKVRAHNLPTFPQAAPSDHIAGTTLSPRHRAGLLQQDHQSQAAAPKSTKREGVERRRPHHL